MRNNFLTVPAYVLLLLAVAPGGIPQPTIDQKPYAQPQRLIDIGDGRRLNLYCSGSGSPTVVLDYGFGSMMVGWGYVQPALAKTHRTCAYDRAGYGFSDSGPVPRTTSAIVTDLHSLLHRGHIKPPYLMVGHSLGGFDARLFADRYPSEVAGMVLIDPAVEDIATMLAPIRKIDELDKADRRRQARCETMTIHRLFFSHSDFWKSCLGPMDPSWTPATRVARIATKEKPGYWKDVASELAVSATIDAQEVRNEQRNYRNMPLIVLTGAQTYSVRDAKKLQTSAGEMETLERLWTESHDRIAKASQRGVNCIVTGTSHFIQIDRPSVVISAIEHVTKLTRARGEPKCSQL